MKTKINSEFLFTKELFDGTTVSLTLYIDYVNKTYDFMQSNEEGIFPRIYNSETHTNKGFLELGLELLEFVKSELEI